MEIEIELAPDQKEMESQITALCVNVIKVNNRLVCVPQREKLMDLILLLMRNNIKYQLKTA